MLTCLPDDADNDANRAQCVPTIFWTTLVLFARLLPYHTSIPLVYGPFRSDVIFNLSTVLYLGYALYFLILEVRPLHGVISGRGRPAADSASGPDLRV